MAETFDMFAIVELFGHARIAGRVSEQVIAGQGFLRVDVPGCPPAKGNNALPAFTRLYGPGAVYSITPCSEEVATAAAMAMRERPVNMYLLAIPQLSDRIEADYGDEDDFDDEEEIDG